MFVRKVMVTERGKKQVCLDVFRDVPGRDKRAKPIARLGPIGLAGRELDRLVRGLTELCEKKLALPRGLSAEHVRSWGPVAVAQHLWQGIGLGPIVSKACGRSVSGAVFALTANRFADPQYEHGMDAWLEKNFVPDESGALDPGRPRKVPSNRGASGCDFWDSVLRGLAAKRRAIEQGLFDVARRGGGLCDGAVLYELSTDFVERRIASPRLAGHPAQSQTRNIRFFFGAAMCGDWPLRFALFGGSEPEASQLKRFARESQRRFGCRTVLVVLPSGIEEERLEQLRSVGLHYLVGVRRRRDPKALEVIREAGRKGLRIDRDMEVQEVLLPAESGSAPSVSDEEGAVRERYFLVHRKEDEREERALRIASIRRSLRALEELKQAVDAGRLKKPAAIMAEAEKILAYDKGYRYISWRVTPEGRFEFCFEFWEDKEKSAVQQSYEGISLLKTSDPELSPGPAVQMYERLRRLEDAFDSIPDAVGYRPAALPLPEPVEDPARGEVASLLVGHLLVSQLALVLRSRLEELLVEKKVRLSLGDVIESLRTVSLVELRLGKDRRLLASPGNSVAKSVVRALGIGSLEPVTNPTRRDA